MTENRQPDLRGARPWKFRPQECDGSGHKWSGHAGSVENARGAIRSQARDAFAGSAKAPSADGIAQVGIAAGPAAKIASGDGDDPRMTG